MPETQPASLEASLDRIAEIVDALEGEALPLDAALALFEEGVAHLRAAEARLRQAESRVETLAARPAGEP